MALCISMTAVLMRAGERQAGAAALRQACAASQPACVASRPGCCRAVAAGSSDAAATQQIPAKTSLDQGGAARVVVYEATVPAELSAKPQRLHDVLQQLFPQQFPTSSAAKRSVRRKEVQLNGQTVRQVCCTVKGGEVVQVVRRSRAASPPPQPRWSQAVGSSAGAQLPVLWEDDYVAVVVKPQGMPTDGSADSVRAHLCRRTTPSMAVGALARPMYAHRLDQGTGGLLVAGKTRQALAALSGAFRERRVEKCYQALVWGRLEGRGLIHYELDERPCTTEYHAVGHTPVSLAALTAAAAHVPAEGLAVEAPPASSAPGSTLDRAGSCEESTGGAAQVAWVTRVDLKPHTGRMHQLRRHMALVGHPLVADKKYTHGYKRQREEGGYAAPPEQHVRLGRQGHDQPASCSSSSAQEAAVDVSQHAAAALKRLAPQPPICLWALRLELVHPETGEQLVFEIPEPASYAELLRKLEGSDPW